MHTYMDTDSSTLINKLTSVPCRCEEGLLDNMVLGPNIAKNAALRENVFMMAICIELRIPLFLIGKPGSSKSLAKSIIQDSMHGRESQSPVLREFKEVSVISETFLHIPLYYVCTMSDLAGTYILVSMHSAVYSREYNRGV